MSIKNETKSIVIQLSNEVDQNGRQTLLAMREVDGQWLFIGCNTIWRLMEIIVSNNAIEFESGRVMFNGNTILPENYIKHWRNCLAQPIPFISLIKAEVKFRCKNISESHQMNLYQQLISHKSATSDGFFTFDLKDSGDAKHFIQCFCLAEDVLLVDVKMLGVHI